ncbi:dTDP-4-dehydrorhamnose reductase [Allofrancisella inopinata]|uniref:dTDP-4-dehydrorhamnose reductase n=1 Tax=Allofrancisella inopinata TaxID=1085647 RepID=A0AAE7CQF4_9GAMM|nr:SDR family oxidoreductase [Allofrancisella inopinata]QIV95702.1 SDR family oxidoreductase [Allofrancisella inopinata]TDT72160.1 dTDP-4-dehydrorhamnose reductase [Allofrancisella inopinata]
MSNRVLVLGCNGMAGHVISIYLESRGHIVDKLARSQKVFADTILVDVSDFELLEKTIVEGRYDFVINAVGVLNADAEANHDKAVLMNSYLPNFLARVTKNLKTKIIHISTDCVFSGDKGSYTELDITDTNTFYGKSKALGELNDDKNLTIRTSIIGPDINENGIGLFNWFMKSRFSKELSGYSKAIWGGVTTIELAKSIEIAMRNELSGLHHLTNNQKINKYDLLSLFKKYFADDSLNILKNECYITDKSLKSNNHFFNVPSYKQMILEMREWIVNNQEIYNY